MEKKTTENNVFFMDDGIVNEDVLCPEVIESRLCNSYTLGLVEREGGLGKNHSMYRGT